MAAGFRVPLLWPSLAGVGFQVSAAVLGVGASVAEALQAQPQR